MHRPSAFTRLAFVLAGALLAASAPASALDPAAPAIDGIRCDSMESGTFHIHQHLEIYDHGKAVTIPSDVGRPLTANCLYWLHTHTADGLIHVESPEIRTFTLGNFFDVWGEKLDATHVGPVRIRKGELRAYLDGHPYSGDPRKIELTEHAVIVLEAGKPYHPPKPFAAWRGA